MSYDNVNLVEALQRRANEAREFIARLDHAARLMGKGDKAESDPGLAISKAITQERIARIEQAIASGDVIVMLGVAKDESIDGGES